MLFYCDTFGQVTRLIDVASAQDGGMVGNQLQGDYGEHRGQERDCRRDGYRGGLLRITDANNEVLAELMLREISHYNITYHYYEVEIAFEQPATERGFIVGLSWDAKDGIKEGDAKNIPILFEK